MDKFRKEAKELSTADLKLILEDQADLYSDEEFKILRKELVCQKKTFDIA